MMEKKASGINFVIGVDPHTNQAQTSLSRRRRKRLISVGVDGGGTKTVAALADTSGKILKKVTAGPSNPNKVGEKLAILRLGRVINKVIAGHNTNTIGSIYIALAGSLERDFEKRKRIKRLLVRRFPRLRSLAGKIKVDGDQKAAFCSGTDEKDGVVLIAGTGSIAMGWRGDEEKIAGGWDYIMGDQGSAFWTGQEALRIICKELDGSISSCGILRKLILKHWQTKNETDVIKKVYGPSLVENIASLSIIVDKAAQKEDAVAKDILQRSGQELALMALTVIKKLGFQKSNFPLVLIGGMFKSKIVLNTVKQEIKKAASGAKFILPKQEPVMGTVKLAIDEVKGGRLDK